MTENLPNQPEHLTELDSLIAWVMDLKARRFQQLPSEVKRSYAIAQKRATVNPWAEVCAEFHTAETNLCRFLSQAEQELRNAISELGEDETDRSLVRTKKRNLKLAKSRDTAEREQADLRGEQG